MSHPVEKFEISNDFPPWIQEVTGANIHGSPRFITCLSRDIEAVKSAIKFEYSNGLAEGCANKTKVIKQIMYGQNHFDMLRTKLLSY